MFDIRDRATQGFIAGMVGAFFEMCFTLSMYSLHILRFRYMDFASTVTFNHLPKGWLESILAEAIVWIFSGSLGVIFSLSIKQISSKNLLIKGPLFGVSVWFIICIMITAFQIKPLFPLDTVTAVIQMLGGLVWGFFTAWVYLYFNKKYGLPSD